MNHLKPTLLYLWKNAGYIAGCTLVGFAVFAPDGTRDLYYSIVKRQEQFNENANDYREHLAYRYIRRGFPTSTPKHIKNNNRSVVDGGRPAHFSNWPIANAATYSTVLTNYLIQNGTNVNHRGPYGYTALHYAQSFGTYRALIEAGADVNALGGFNATPLDVASFEDPQVLKYLLDHGARNCVGYCYDSFGPAISPSLGKPEFGGPDDTPEYLAFLAKYQTSPEYNRLLSLQETVDRLLDRYLPSSRQVPDRYPISPLNDSTRQFIKVIFEFKPNLNRINKDGKSVLMKLCENLKPQLDIGQVEDELIVKAIQDGAKVNYVNPKDGCTALHYAVMNHYFPAVKALLSHGADPNIRNKAGKRPADLASNFEEVLR